MTKIKRLLKYVTGGKVIKMQNGLKFPELNYQYNGYTPKPLGLGLNYSLQSLPTTIGLTVEQTTQLYSVDNFNNDINKMRDTAGLASDISADQTSTNTQTPTNTQEKPSGKLSNKAAAALGMASQIGYEVINGVDQAVMGDKNFSASSQAIDAGVHGVSSALIKSGNPYAAAAAVALEGINFVTKAAGKNVQGYDVNINNSGYGNLGHMDSEAGRIWDSWTGATARKLKRRNLQVKMALAAADVSEDVAYEQEARTNSVTNVLQLNQIALAGGIDLSLLGN